MFVLCLVYLKVCLGLDGAVRNFHNNNFYIFFSYFNSEDKLLTIFQRNSYKTRCISILQVRQDIMASTAVRLRSPCLQRGGEASVDSRGGWPAHPLLQRGSEGSGSSRRCTFRGFLILADITRLAAVLAAAEIEQQGKVLNSKVAKSLSASKRV